jgi:hypothetical protein
MVKILGKKKREFYKVLMEQPSVTAIKRSMTQAERANDKSNCPLRLT